MKRTAILIAAAVLIAACGGGKGSKPSGKIVNIYIWTNYLPQEVVDQFERRTGIHANVDTYDSNEAVLAKLEQKYPNEIVVIGVHTPKFYAERDTENIRRKVREYQVRHPVINDANQTLWDRFGGVAM